MSDTRTRPAHLPISRRYGRCPHCGGTMLGSQRTESSCINCGYVTPHNTGGYETVLSHLLEMTPSAFERAVTTLNRRQRNQMHEYALDRARRIRLQVYELKEEHDRLKAIAKLCREPSQVPLGERGSA